MGMSKVKPFKQNSDFVNYVIELNVTEPDLTDKSLAMNAAYVYLDIKELFLLILKRIRYNLYSKLVWNVFR